MPLEPKINKVTPMDGGYWGSKEVVGGTLNRSPKEERRLKDTQNTCSPEGWWDFHVMTSDIANKSIKTQWNILIISCWELPLLASHSCKLVLFQGVVEVY